MHCVEAEGEIEHSTVEASADPMLKRNVVSCFPKKYLALDDNADEVVHRPSLPSESPATTSGVESGHIAVIAASIAAPPPLLPPPPPAPIEAIRRNRLTGPTFLSVPFSSSSDSMLPPPLRSRSRTDGGTGFGMEAQAIDPSE